DEVSGEQRVLGRRAAEAEGFRVVCGDLLRVEKASELTELDLGDDHLVAGRDSHPATGPRDAEQLLVWIQHKLLDRTFAPGDGLGLDRGSGGGDCLIERVHPAQEAAELEAAKDLLQSGAVGR